MAFEFHGTRLTGHGTASDLQSTVQALRRRGVWHARFVRSSGWLLFLAFAGAVLCLVLGEIEAFFVIGIVAILVAAIKSGMVPELAEDPRLAFVEAFVGELSLPARGGIETAIELNAFDCEAPEKLEQIEGGKLRARYLQRWLELAFPREGERYRLHIEVDVAQTEDGIERSDESRKTRVILSREGHRSSLIPGPEEGALPGAFTRAPDGAYVARGESIGAVEIAALVDAILD